MISDKLTTLANELARQDGFYAAEVIRWPFKAPTKEQLTETVRATLSEASQSRINRAPACLPEDIAGTYIVTMESETKGTIIDISFCEVANRVAKAKGKRAKKEPLLEH